MHPDKDMKILLLHVSETLWLELFSHTHTVGIICQRRISTLHTSPHHYCCCAMDPNVCFLHAMSSCSTVSSANRICNIGSLETKTTYNIVGIQNLSAYYRGFCLTQAVCLLYKPLCFCRLYIIDINPCEWGNQNFVCFCYRQICNIPPQKQPYHSM